MIALLLFACKTEPTPVEPTDRAEVPTPLDLPDTSDVDFEASFRQALELALTVNANTLFGSHRMAIETFEPSCPDVYVGVPPEDVAEVEGVRMDNAPGLTWTDHCAQDSGTTFSGHAYWDAEVAVQGASDTPEGRTVDADRRLIADGVVGGPDGVVFEFDGEASDAVSRVDATDFTSWAYTSLVDGTATGSHPFPDGSATPDGWRTDLYVSMEGGDVDRIELRGNAYFFEPQLVGRFDSFAVDLDLQGELGAGPDDCTAEPLGWIGLRDSDAVWYDLVFLPRYANDITAEPYPNDPLQACDGCGTLYIRGVEQGTVCPDFAGIFDLSPPTLEDLVLSARMLPQPDDGGTP